MLLLYFLRPKITLTLLFNSFFFFEKLLRVNYRQIIYFYFQLLRRYRLEYHHEPLEYAVTFMYAPDGPLRLRMLERST